MTNEVFKPRILNLKRVTQKGRVCWRFFHVTGWKREDARHGNMWAVVGVPAGAGIECPATGVSWADSSCWLFVFPRLL